jgi:energy-coupling factor transporter ATP-binding protein EcfA2
MTTIKIIENPKIELPRVEFNCDKCLNSELKNVPMLWPLVSSHKVICLLGKSGSGKTSLLMSWLLGKKSKRVFRKSFENVFLFMPRASRESLKQNPFKKHKPEKMFDSVTEDNLEELIETLKSNKENGERNLVIFDDCGAQLKKSARLQRLMADLNWNKRHYATTVIYLLQSFRSCPKNVRSGFNILAIFKPSLQEMEVLCDETFEMQKDTTRELMSYAFEEPHDYLILDIDSQRIFKDYNEIVIKTKDENELEVEREKEKN